MTCSASVRLAENDSSSTGPVGNSRAKKCRQNNKWNWIKGANRDSVIILLTMLAMRAMTRFETKTRVRLVENDEFHFERRATNLPEENVTIYVRWWQSNYLFVFASSFSSPASPSLPRLPSRAKSNAHKTLPVKISLLNHSQQLNTVYESNASSNALGVWWVTVVSCDAFWRWFSRMIFKCRQWARSVDSARSLVAVMDDEISTIFHCDRVDWLRLDLVEW